jgi:transcriptional regulator with XRE-family HTH domain
VGESNSEFRRLLAASGWERKKASEVLGVTESAISQYVNDRNEVSTGILRLFKELLKDTMPLPGETELYQPGARSALGQDDPAQRLADRLVGDEMEFVRRLREAISRMDREHRAQFLQNVCGLAALVAQEPSSTPVGVAQEGGVSYWNKGGRRPSRRRKPPTPLPIASKSEPPPGGMEQLLDRIAPPKRLPR